ncbi:5-amino-6-(D-ribitylamino)uracil--L-tyrosine 4-hydroxyphenyl transferase CofH [Sphingomonas immobilis]|uniref:FO synthase n=1 Tax=Sphingomonas immobilis TaxID=3063997 RepID=A0ABT9A014_9SPHN|nr:5-amino-6-(D-ribitylamino)uracil--L-tyrosine 4-hydroxyphenyl transferase CofH [Sphingomonas sp. CA1-15]MDO7843178.1 5-amino-6-(D-ribitylamino)uracil--L-tyrosine 4-hydroxyphenyl transferase CofH [Sphingomonas sp. CA1-15]
MATGSAEHAALAERLLAASPETLAAEARRIRDRASAPVHTYSPKVFIPLTQLCRNVCHYCTFAHPPRRGERSYLPLDEILAIARAGRDAGCHEALFTLGDRPEARYAAARSELSAMGYDSTVEYLAAACAAVIAETGLLPHVNAGVLTRDEMARLRKVSASQGMMLESVSTRLCERGGPHFGSPDKLPARRLRCIEDAGELAIPFTSGILIGIGETRRERIDALLALRALHERHGHIQEIIVQNFRAKPGTKMASAAEPDQSDLIWTAAAARIVFGADMAIQVPPNLNAGRLGDLIDAGIDDWGGVSPVTADHVNPEAPWPERDLLRRETAAAGRVLTERLTLYPAFVRNPERWLDPAVRTPVLHLSGSDGLARGGEWAVGRAMPFPPPARSGGNVRPVIRDLVARAGQGEALDEADVAMLLATHGAEYGHVCKAADDLRRRTVGDAVSYVVTRNINYTNMCRYACTFCAFSKGRGNRSLRGPAYDLDLAEVARRAVEAQARGASEVCMQGGIHPAYTGQTYLDLLATVRSAAPGLHVHAFSPLEVVHGATTLGVSVEHFLTSLRDAGLGSLPGTAAEILDERVRPALCPDKLDTRSWLDVIETAHRVGLRTTATIMFGHLDGPEHWARHLLEIRALQARTGGFTEFVPLPFVHDEAPLFLAGKARRGPSAREAVLMHAVARLVLHPLIPNIQVSWVKLGADGARACLDAGANDLGGTLMNESISSAAGASHGQEMDAVAMEALIAAAGRTPRLRTTLYGDAPPRQRFCAMAAAPLEPVRLTRPRRRQPVFDGVSA